jgi:hypothetical protein
MATISAQDYGLFREALYQGEGKTLLKAQPALPNEFALRAIAAAIEDRFTASLSLVQGDIQRIVGAPVDPALTLAMVRAWTIRRLQGGK